MFTHTVINMEMSLSVSKTQQWTCKWVSLQRKHLKLRCFCEAVPSVFWCFNGTWREQTSIVAEFSPSKWSGRNNILWESTTPLTSAWPALPETSGAAVIWIWRLKAMHCKYHAHLRSLRAHRGFLLYGLVCLSLKQSSISTSLHLRSSATREVCFLLFVAGVLL